MKKKYRNFMYESQIECMQKRGIPIEIEKLAQYVEKKLDPVEYAIILHDKDVSSVDEEKLVAPHYHIALKFKNARRLDNIAKIFNELPQNFEIWTTQPNNMYSYLIHRTSLANKKYQYNVHDVLANFDFESRINKITSSVNSGRKKSIQNLIDAYGHEEISFEKLMNELSPTEYASNERKINVVKKLVDNQRFEAFKANMEKENKQIEVIYLYGNTGTGKTRFKENRFITGSNRDLFANYDGEKIVILDELRPDSLSYNELLKFTDPFNFENVVGSRYFDKKIVAETIIITSPFSPLDFYKSLKKESNSSLLYSDVDKKEQFFRRINVFQFDYDLIFPMLWDSEKQTYQKQRHLQKTNEWSETITFSTKKDLEVITTNLFDF